MFSPQRFTKVVLFVLAGAFLAMAKPAWALEDYNVVLIFVDTLRSDHLGCYGYPRGTSPAIDSLAREGVIFDNNFSTASYTCASFTSVNTSLYPVSHGVREVLKDRLSTRVKTLAQILKAYGYLTVWYAQKDPHLDPGMGFGAGCSQSIHNVRPGRLWEMRQVLCGLLEKQKRKRFFINFHVSNVHAPYCPAQKYKRFFVTDSTGMISTDRTKIEKLCLSSSSPRGRGIDFFVYWEKLNLGDPGANRFAQSIYDACILEFDQEVFAPLVRKLKELGLYEKTIIVVCSDHGEEFYEHGRAGHGLTLYDEVVKVPLIIRVPGMAQGRRVEELSQNVDIMPTLLELLGIPLPAQTQGVSWKEALDPGWRPHPLREYVFGQNLDKDSIRSKEWKLIRNRSTGKRELYRVSADPGERSDLFAQEPDVAEKMESQLQLWEALFPPYGMEGLEYPPSVSEKTRANIRKRGYW